ncbi:hypothetical protein SCATT_53920 [Streptantibioticus cattleyicolor NRRL 8057 = DSM 46488]|uniref:Uncharacterized protein n=1 Tax=Streptantibioticus cattleyicolor (strain ATCC 35852 / DSM 46488 / JCM 4925 / NBRC 14057 / NRRL 8057) TaxID=1003195 RepID=G8WVK6_STREN|nr:hypothetical protein SCATT_53920 [Streptantibioticus cattleyicolor NRRL 8057 = DSM 46488]
MSTERPGPTRVAPAARGLSPLPARRRERALGGPRSVPRALDLAPSGAAALRRGTPWPSGGRRRTRRIPGRTSCGGPGRTYSPATAACQHPFDLRESGESAGQCGSAGGGATGRGHIVRRYGQAPRHSFGP